MTRVAHTADFFDPREQLTHESKLTTKMENVVQLMADLVEPREQAELELSTGGWLTRRAARQRISAIDEEVSKLNMLMQLLEDGWDVDLAILKEKDKLVFQDALRNQVGADAMAAASKKLLGDDDESAR
jgi:hypothetical protein